MVLCIMGIARIASLQWWTRSEAAGTALLCCLTYDAFVRLDHELACICVGSLVGLEGGE